MREYLGNNSYRKKTFSNSEKDTYYNYSVGFVRFPMDYYLEPLNSEVITYKIEDLEKMKESRF